MCVVFPTFSNSLELRFELLSQKSLWQKERLYVSEVRSWPWAVKVPEGEIEPSSKGSLIDCSSSNFLEKFCPWNIELLPLGVQSGLRDMVFRMPQIATTFGGQDDFWAPPWIQLIYLFNNIYLLGTHLPCAKQHSSMGAMFKFLIHEINSA